MNLSKLFIGLSIFYVLLIYTSFKYIEHKEIEFNNAMIVGDAKSAFDKDITFRKWVSMHGGVYVPITKKTPPNPYLAHIPNRDITSTTGIKLTLMNPAYALRQFMQNFEGSYGDKGKITSLKLINPNNAPDDFEKAALLRFEKSSNPKEYFEKLKNSKDENEFRYIKPLVIKQSCLKCHSQQGYKAGDIRGGISITLPLKKYEDYLESQLSSIKIIHILALFLGLISLYLFCLYIKKSQDKEVGLNKQVNEIHTIFNSGNIILFRWNNDENWSIDYVSDNVKSLLGYTKEEFMRGNILYSSLIDAQDVKRVTQEVIDASKSGITNFVHESYRVKKKNGDVIWVNDASQVIRDKNGEIKFYVGYIQDITKIKQYELAIQNEQERFQLAVDGSNDGLWDWNPQTNEVYFSPKWKNMLGYEEHEIKPELDEWMGRVHPDDIEKAVADVQAHIDGKTKVYENEQRMKHKDGYWIWILDRGKALVDSNGVAQRFVGFHTDITHIKDQEVILKLKIKEALAQNTKQLQIIQQQNKMASMGEMIGAIAHQWRQPLNELGLSIQNLKYDYKADTIDEKFISEFIDYNKKTIMFMSRTIDDFRSFFRVDKIKKDFNIKETTESVISMLNGQLNNNNITTSITGDEFVYKGFQSEYQQVVLNIISNAKDALQKTKNPNIDIIIQDHKISIKDNAGGIPQDIINRVFEPYFTTKAQGEGTGMGLYMSKIIVEDNMHGSLSVHNDTYGACFTIDFNHLNDT